MANTNTTTLAPAIPTEILEPLILSYLREGVVLTNMVRQKDISGIPGLKYDFNSFGSLAFGAKVQNTDFVPAALSISEDGTVTAGEVGLALDIPDIAREAVLNMSDDDLAREIANAAAAKIEGDLAAQFTSFTTTKGTTNTALSVTAFEDAALALRQAKAPATPQANSNLPPDLAGYFTVLAESGVAQLATALRSANIAPGAPSVSRMLETLGAASAAAARFSYLGINVFGSDLVATTSTDRNGAMLCPAALGLVMKRAPRIERQRRAIGTSELHVGSAVYGVGVIKQAFGVEIIHKA